MFIKIAQYFCAKCLIIRLLSLYKYVYVCADKDDIHTPVHPQERNNDRGEAAVGGVPAAVDDKQREKPCKKKPRASGGRGSGDKRRKASGSEIAFLNIAVRLDGGRVRLFDGVSKPKRRCDAVEIYKSVRRET